MSKPVASTTLTFDDLVRFAAPRLLDQAPMLSLQKAWKFAIERLPDGGVRVDMLEPVAE